MAVLVRSQQSVLFASLLSLTLAAACEVTVPYYTSRALNAAAFSKDPVVSAHRGRRVVGTMMDASEYESSLVELFHASAMV